jgi:hypothetical protein
MSPLRGFASKHCAITHDSRHGLLICRPSGAQLVISYVAPDVNYRVLWRERTRALVLERKGTSRLEHQPTVVAGVRWSRLSQIISSLLLMTNLWRACQLFGGRHAYLLALASIKKDANRCYLRAVISESRFRVHALLL